MLNRNTPKQIADLRTILFSSLGHAAVANGDVHELDDLICRGMDLNISDLHSRRTILHTAAASGKENIVRFLIDQGAKIDVVDQKQRTPLQVQVLVLYSILHWHLSLLYVQ